MWAERLIKGSYPDGDCLRWIGAHNRKGYGKVNWKRADGTRVQDVHRVAYEVWVGPIPAELEVDHRCNVRDCVNPDHLQLLTHAENVWRASGATFEFCAQGHPRTPENLYEERRANGKVWQQCRPCRLARDSRRHARERGAA